MCMGMMALGLRLRDGGGWIYAGIDGVFTDDGNGWVEGFGVEVLEVHGIIWPRHVNAGLWKRKPRCLFGGVATKPGESLFVGPLLFEISDQRDADWVMGKSLEVYRRWAPSNGTPKGDCARTNESEGQKTRKRKGTGRPHSQVPQSRVCQRLIDEARTSLKIHHSQG